jgi:hypothetical protein
MGAFDQTALRKLGEIAANRRRADREVLGEFEHGQAVPFLDKGDELLSAFGIEHARVIPSRMNDHLRALCANLRGVVSRLTDRSSLPMLPYPIRHPDHRGRPA